MGKKLKKKLKLKRLKSKKKQANAVSSAPPPPSPPWLELPQEVTANILHRLGAHDILESAQKVCSTWRNVCKDPSMWRVIDMKNLGEYDGMSGYLATMCRHAVDRSEGQLTDIDIDYFAIDELLLYISERSSQLRCLRLRGCYRISGDGLSEAAKIFPLLEELHFVFVRNCNDGIEAIGRSCPKLRSSQLRCLRLGGCYGVSGDGLSEAAKRFPLLEELHFVFVKNCNDGIEATGHSCPKLRSFTLSESGYKYPQLVCNDDALAIAKSMPGLHHLQLLGNNMTNEGLQAILDGCPLLESLDIRKCFNVDLSGDLGNRIAQKIKDFKCPEDSMEDCEWNTEIFDCEEYDEYDYYSSEISVFSHVDYYDEYDDVDTYIYFD